MATTPSERPYSAKNFDEATPNGMAYKLAERHSDVGFIRGYVSSFYGEHKAPSRQTIQSYIDHQRRPPKEYNPTNRTLGYTPDNDTGEYELKPARSVVRKVKREELKRAAPSVAGALPLGFTTRPIFQDVASAYKMSLDEIRGPSRSRRCVMARSIIVALLCEYTIDGERRFSDSRIGGFLGGRDRNTVLHSRKQFEKWREECDEVGELYEWLREKYHGGGA